MIDSKMLEKKILYKKENNHSIIYEDENKIYTIEVMKMILC